MVKSSSKSADTLTVISPMTMQHVHDVHGRWAARPRLFLCKIVDIQVVVSTTKSKVSPHEVLDARGWQATPTSILFDSTAEHLLHLLVTDGNKTSECVKPSH